jgi:hypothetical protein
MCNMAEIIRSIVSASPGLCYFAMESTSRYIPSKRSLQEPSHLPSDKSKLQTEIAKFTLWSHSYITRNDLQRQLDETVQRCRSAGTCYLG